MFTSVYFPPTLSAHIIIHNKAVLSYIFCLFLLSGFLISRKEGLKSLRWHVNGQPLHSHSSVFFLKGAALLLLSHRHWNSLFRTEIKLWAIQSWWKKPSLQYFLGEEFKNLFWVHVRCSLICWKVARYETLKFSFTLIYMSSESNKFTANMLNYINAQSMENTSRAYILRTFFFETRSVQLDL